MTTPTPTHYARFVAYCEKRNIRVKLTQEKYNEMRIEIVPHLIKVNVVWKEEVGKLVDWLYDKELKTINAQRIRNWMRKAHHIAQKKFAAFEERRRENAHMRGSRTAYTPSSFAGKLTKLV